MEKEEKMEETAPAGKPEQEWTNTKAGKIGRQMDYNWEEKQRRKSRDRGDMTKKKVKIGRIYGKTRKLT